MLKISATTAVAFLLVMAGRGRSSENMVAQPPEASLLCVSKCDACPVVCSPRSPPKSPGGAVLSPPSPPSSSSSSPAGGRDRGGASYPYYYFYTAGADRSHGLVFGFLWLLPLLVLSFAARSNLLERINSVQFKFDQR